MESSLHVPAWHPGPAHIRLEGLMFGAKAIITVTSSSCKENKDAEFVRIGMPTADFREAGSKIYSRTDVIEHFRDPCANITSRYPEPLRGCQQQTSENLRIRPADIACVRRK